MKTILILLVAITGALAGCGNKPAQRTVSAATNPPVATSQTATASGGYLGALVQAQKLAVKTVDLASLNQAIQTFNVQEERYPTDLNELVAKRYLPRLPDPPRGMKFQYDPRTGQIRVIPQ